MFWCTKKGRRKREEQAAAAEASLLSTSSSSSLQLPASPPPTSSSASAPPASPSLHAEPLQSPAPSSVAAAPHSKTDDGKRRTTRPLLDQRASNSEMPSHSQAHAQIAAFVATSSVDSRSSSSPGHEQHWTSKREDPFPFVAPYASALELQSIDDVLSLELLHIVPLLSFRAELRRRTDEQRCDAVPFDSKSNAWPLPSATAAERYELTVACCEGATVTGLCLVLTCNAVQQQPLPASSHYWHHSEHVRRLLGRLTLSLHTAEQALFTELDVVPHLRLPVFAEQLARRRPGHDDSSAEQLLLHLPVHVTASQLRLCFDADVWPFTAVRLLLFGCNDGQSPAMRARRKLFRSGRVHLALFEHAVDAGNDAQLRCRATEQLLGVLLAAPHSVARLHGHLSEQALFDLLQHNVAGPDEQLSCASLRLLQLLLLGAEQQRQLFVEALLRLLASDAHRYLASCRTPTAQAALALLLRWYAPAHVHLTASLQCIEQLGADLLRANAESALRSCFDVPPLPLDEPLFSRHALLEQLRASPLVGRVLPPDCYVPSPLDWDAELFASTPDYLLSEFDDAGAPVAYRWNSGVSASFAGPAHSGGDALPLKYLDTHVGNYAHCFLQLPPNALITSFRLSLACAEPHTVCRLLVVGYPDAIAEHGVCIAHTDFVRLQQADIVRHAPPPQRCYPPCRYWHVMFLSVHSSMRTTQTVTVRMALRSRSHAASAAAASERFSALQGRLADLADKLSALPPSQLFPGALDPRDEDEVVTAVSALCSALQTHGSLEQPHALCRSRQQLRCAIDQLLGQLSVAVDAAALSPAASPLDALRAVFPCIAKQCHRLCCDLYFRLASALLGAADFAGFLFDLLRTHFAAAADEQQQPPWPRFAVFTSMVQALRAQCRPADARSLLDALLATTLAESQPAPAPLVSWVLLLVCELAALLRHDVPASHSDVHVGYRCDCCGVSPIQGVRYRCAHCPAVDFCAKCAAVDHVNHAKLGHRRVAIPFYHVDQHTIWSDNDSVPPPSCSSSSLCCRVDQLSGLFSAESKCDACGREPRLRCVHCPLTLCCDECATSGRLQAPQHGPYHCYLQLDESMRTRSGEAVLNLALCPAFHAPLYRVKERPSAATVAAGEQRRSAELLLAVLCSRPDQVAARQQDCLLAIRTLQHLLPTCAAGFFAGADFTSLLLDWLTCDDYFVRTAAYDLLAHIAGAKAHAPFHRRLLAAAFARLSELPGLLAAERLLHVLLVVQPAQLSAEQTGALLALLLPSLPTAENGGRCYAAAVDLLSIGPSALALASPALVDSLAMVCCHPLDVQLLVADSVSLLLQRCLKSHAAAAGLAFVVALVGRTQHMAFMNIHHDAGVFAAAFRALPLFVRRLIAATGEAPALPGSFVLDVLSSFCACFERSCFALALSDRLEEPARVLLALFEEPALRQQLVGLLVAEPSAEPCLVYKLLRSLAELEAAAVQERSGRVATLSVVESLLCTWATTCDGAMTIVLRAALTTLGHSSSLLIAGLVHRLVSLHERHAHAFFIGLAGHQLLLDAVFPTASSDRRCAQSPARQCAQLAYAAQSALSPHALIGTSPVEPLAQPSVVASEPGELPAQLLCPAAHQQAPSPATLLLRTLDERRRLWWRVRLPDDCLLQQVRIHFVENWRQQGLTSALPRELHVRFAASESLLDTAAPQLHKIDHPSPPPVKLGNRLLTVVFAVREPPSSAAPHYCCMELLSGLCSGELLVAVAGVELACRRWHSPLLRSAHAALADSADGQRSKVAVRSNRTASHAFEKALLKLLVACVACPAVARDYVRLSSLGVCFPSMLAARVESSTDAELNALCEEVAYHLCKTCPDWAAATLAYLLHHAADLSPAQFALLAALMALPDIDPSLGLHPLQRLLAARLSRPPPSCRSHGMLGALAQALDRRLLAGCTAAQLLAAGDVVPTIVVRLFDAALLSFDSAAAHDCQQALQLLAVLARLDPARNYALLLRHSRAAALLDRSVEALKTVQLLAVLAACRPSCCRLLCDAVPALAELLAKLIDCEPNGSDLFAPLCDAVCALGASLALRRRFGWALLPALVRRLVERDADEQQLAGLLRCLLALCRNTDDNQQLLCALLMDAVRGPATPPRLFHALAQLLRLQHWAVLCLRKVSGKNLIDHLPALPVQPADHVHRSASATGASAVGAVAEWRWDWLLEPGDALEISHDGAQLKPRPFHDMATIRTAKPLLPRGVHRWDVQAVPISFTSTSPAMPVGFSFGVCSAQQPRSKRIGAAPDVLAYGFDPVLGTLSVRGQSSKRPLPSDNALCWRITVDFTRGDVLFLHPASGASIEAKSPGDGKAFALALYPCLTIPSTTFKFVMSNYQWERTSTSTSTSTSAAAAASLLAIPADLYRCSFPAAVLRPDLLLTFPCPRHAATAQQLCRTVASWCSELSCPVQIKLTAARSSNDDDNDGDVVELDYELEAKQPAASAQHADEPACGAAAGDGGRYPIMDILFGQADAMPLIFERLAALFRRLPRTGASRLRQRWLSLVQCFSRLPAFNYAFFYADANLHTSLSFFSAQLGFAGADPFASNAATPLADAQLAAALLVPPLSSLAGLLANADEALCAALLQHRLVDKLLAELSLSFNIKHRAADVIECPGGDDDDSGNNNQADGGGKAASSNSPAATAQAWSAGTGYGTASSSYNEKWNVELHNELNALRHSYAAALLNLLATYLQRLRDVPALLLRKLDGSCLVAVLASLLRNESLVEVVRAADLYQALFRLIEAAAQLPPLRVLLVAVPSRADSLLALLRAMTERFRSMFAAVQKWRATDELQHGDNVVDDNDSRPADDAVDPIEYDFFLSTSTTLDAIEALLAAELAPDCASSSASSLRSAEQQYQDVLRPWQFMERANVHGSSHFFHSVFSLDGKPSLHKTKRLVRELASLRSTLPLFLQSSIFLHVSDQRPDVMQALITGPADTPYSAGCFVFDVYTGANYPNSPPVVNLMTTGAGTVRFNPNLYATGFVCLSLLGTWAGAAQETWNPKTSTLLQVLVSIQSLIFSAQPYFNEPGFESRMHTAAGQSESEAYNEKIRLATARWAIVEQLRIPPLGFKPVVVNHFKLRSAEVLQQVRDWRNQSKSNKKAWNSILVDLKAQLQKIDQLPFFTVPS